MGYGASYYIIVPAAAADGGGASYYVIVPAAAADRLSRLGLGLGATYYIIVPAAAADRLIRASVGERSEAEEGGEEEIKHGRGVGRVMNSL